MAQRLADAGWRTGRTADEVTAARGDWRLTVHPSGHSVADGPATLRAERAGPRLTLILTAVFALLGAFAGRWLARRAGDDLGLLPRLTALNAVGFLLVSAHTLLTAATLAGDVSAAFGTGPFPLPWGPTMSYGTRPVTLIGLLITAIWLAAVFAPRFTRQVGEGRG